MVIDVTAEYIVDGDTVLAVVYVYDPDHETYHPETVKTGTASLQSYGQTLAAVQFDRRAGNEDGSFKFTFAHPPKTRNLKLDVVAELMDGTGFAMDVDVVESLEVHIPLAQNTMQPPINTNEVRRAEEDLL